MKQILLVEDSGMFGRLTKAKLEKEFDVPVYWAKTLAETLIALDSVGNTFSMALLDLNLPDAPNGQVIDHVVAHGISSFVFTSNMCDVVREQMWKKKVADYILKDDPNSLNYIVTAMRRLEKNKASLVMVVDDSSLYRTKVAELLYIQNFGVVTAKNGNEALEILNKQVAIDLIITDFDLPGMDGCQLCQKVRMKYSREDLAIIGLSTEKNKNIGARFIKSGANDVIMKDSFLVEEFYCRVNHCVETIDLMAQIKEASIRDFLTGLYNRRYFFDAGDALFVSSHKEQTSLLCAMIDIDFFKKVNDTHGHDVGDLVIQQVASLIESRMQDSDIVARFGGEEFCVLAAGLEEPETEELFKEMLYDIATTPVWFGGKEGNLNVTVSIGVCIRKTDRLDHMTKLADELLYDAKESGRNCVRISQ